MVRRSVLRALCTGNGPVEVASRRLGAAQPLRTFSSTAQRDAQMTSFTPTSSLELDKKLDDIRSKIIMPCFLPVHQQKKMHSPKYQHKLKNDPFQIEIDGEVFKFRYRPIQDYPETRKTIIEAIENFSTEEDFANLRPLLEGLHAAKRVLPVEVEAKIIRRAGRHGQLYSVIECARGVQTTNFKLDKTEKPEGILFWTQCKAADAEWDPAQTAQALRWAVMVVDMLQDPAHKLTNASSVQGKLPIDRDPQILAAPLHLAAELYLTTEDEQQKQAALAKTIAFAGDVVRFWPEGTGLRELQPIAGDTRHRRHDGNWVRLTSPLLRGLRRAAEALKDDKPELAAQLQKRSESLAGEIETARKSIEPTNIGEVIYKKFLGA